MRVPGFTLIELVVAVTVLAVGVLAVAASAAPLGRLVRHGGAQAVSAAVAGAEIEAVRAAGCAAPASAVAAAGHGLHLAWTLAGGGAPREMAVVTTYPWGPLARSDTFWTAVACPQ